MTPGFTGGPARALALAGVAVALALAPASVASARTDPLAGGTTTLKLSLPDRVTAKALGAASQRGRRIRLPITGGSLDPVTVAGLEKLGGSLKLSYLGGHARLTNLVATFAGRSGALRAKVDGKRSTLGFRRAVTGRAGFGASVRKAELRVFERGAQALNRALGAGADGPFTPDRRFETQAIGTLSTNTIPRTVEVVGGTVSWQLSSGFLAKLAQKSVTNDGIGIRAIEPGTYDQATASFSLPISGGNLAPDGSDGTIVSIPEGHSGSLVFTKRGTMAPGCNTTWPPGNFAQLASPVRTLVAVGARALIFDENYSGQLAPPSDVQFGALTITGAAADPATRQITVTADTTLSLGGVTPLVTAFGDSAHGCGAAGSDFAAGDALGTLTVAVTTH